MANSLKQLINDRRQMLDVLQRNGSAAGIQRLLTDLYPDSAHFVYELLQNAEDAGATRVEFILNGNNYYLLSPGDSISFNSTTPHRWRVIGSRPAKYLWVYTPLVKL